MVHVTNFENKSFDTHEWVPKNVNEIRTCKSTADEKKNSIWMIDGSFVIKFYPVDVLGYDVKSFTIASRRHCKHGQVASERHCDERVVEWVRD